MKRTAIALSVLLLLGLYIGCTRVKLNRTDYNFVTQTVYSDWQEVWEEPVMIDSLLILNTGSVQVPRSGMLNEKKLKAGHGVPERLWVDVFAFLFHHKEKGWFMIDTGLDSSFQNKGNIMGLIAGKYIKKNRQEQGQNIGAQLERLNLRPVGIFFTHLHGDHTAGIPEIDKSIPLYCGKAEQYHDIPILYKPKHFNKGDAINELDMAKGNPIAPFEQVMDVFGDGSFWALATPGHSKSHLSFLLRTEKEIILLTGDASHTRYGFENGIEPGWAYDRLQAESSLWQLHDFAEQFPQVRVIFGHEL